MQKAGYGHDVITQLAEIAKQEKVNAVIIEANFGDGMYTKLLEPVFAKIHPCAIEEVTHTKQKERRIIDTLEPVMARHKLVIDRNVIIDDYQSVQKYETNSRSEKSLIHQLTHITHDRGSIRHDDRLDALAMAVGYWAEQMAQDAQKGLARFKTDMLDKELRSFMKGAGVIQSDGWKPKTRNALFRGNGRWGQAPLTTALLEIPLYAAFPYCKISAIFRV